MTQWNNTLKLKDIIDIDEEHLSEVLLHRLAVDCASRIKVFIDEQGDRIRKTHWEGVYADFLSLSKQADINADVFDGVLDNLYDLADDDKVWIE